MALLLPLMWGMVACSQRSDRQATKVPEVKVVGALKQVMRQGRLNGQIRPDTLMPQQGLYGLGPLSGLTGEILLADGVLYTSTINTQGKVQVSVGSASTAPFFVYSHVPEWSEEPLVDSIKTLQDLQSHLLSRVETYGPTFAFKLRGKVEEAQIHVQNLPPGTKVSSPKEAHQGQVKVSIKQKEVLLIGFFSLAHQGIFTHHDSYLHLHLLTQDHQLMGHLDAATFEKMQLFLPGPP